MMAYEFYWLDEAGVYQMIGVPPERRKHPERITQDSVLAHSNHYSLQEILIEMCQSSKRNF